MRFGDIDVSYNVPGRWWYQVDSAARVVEKRTRLVDSVLRNGGYRLLYEALQSDWNVLS